MSIIKFYLLILLFLTSCRAFNLNPHYEKYNPDSYFLTTEPIIVKNILVPIGTKLTYKKRFLARAFIRKIRNEKLIKSIDLPDYEVINLGGIPIKSIDGYGSKIFIAPVFYKSEKNKRNKLYNIWRDLTEQSYSRQLCISIKTMDDWSFKTKNFLNVSGCGGEYRDSLEGDSLIIKKCDNLYIELMKTDSK